MAAIDRRGKNSWRARVRIPGFGLKTRTFDTKDQAEIWAERIEHELRDGRDTVPNIRAELTLDEALERYEREITPEKKSHVQERRRIAAWRRHEYAKLKLSQLNGQHFRSFRDKRKEAGIAASTVRLDLALISHLYTIARKEWSMPYLSNPIAEVRQAGSDKSRDRRLSAEEFRRFEKAIDTCYNRVIPSIIRFAMETAARKGELLKLTWSDIDLKRRVMILRDTKNGEDRRVPLTQEAVSLLEHLSRDESRRVFLTTSAAITAAWRRILTRAEIEDFRFHDLRHEATTRLFERGLEVMEVQRITGHKTLTMLLRYTQMNVDRIVDRLDETEAPATPASSVRARVPHRRQANDAPGRKRQKSLEHSRGQQAARAIGSGGAHTDPFPIKMSKANRETGQQSNVIAFPGRRQQRSDET